ncbi:MAG: cobalamin biosynthesis protein CobW [Kiloniellales bacterium]
MLSNGKIPATVITGFLGAGKTSTVRHLLGQADGKRLALIVNEFGDLGVDGEILRACGVPGCSEDDIVELANGCICCTVADDFLPTMEALLEREQPPHHIVIETSGLALPKPLVKAFTWPEVRNRVTVDGVIALIDAPAVAAGRFAADEAALAAQRAADPSLDHDSPLEELFEDQLACADLVVLNKCDLIEPERLAKIEQEIAARLRPGVKLLRASHGALPISVLLGLNSAAEGDIDARPSHHDFEAEHDHDDFLSFAVDLGEVSEPETLLARLAPIVAEHDVYRLKGFVAVPGKEMRLVVQGVGSRLDRYFDRDWRAGEERATRLVVIGASTLDVPAVERAIRAAACTS